MLKKILKVIYFGLFSVAPASEIYNTHINGAFDQGGEYPRPELQREQWINLDGTWNYAVRPTSDGKAPVKYDGDIVVPFSIESKSSGVAKKLPTNQFLWYRRTFILPKAWPKNSKALLNFGAVDWDAEVFVNGKDMGGHKGGYTPFSLDITDGLRTGGQQEFVVRVEDETREGGQPVGKQSPNPRTIYYTSVSGIWQTVWLEPVPKEYVEKLKIAPDIDAGTVTVTALSNAKMGVKVKVLGELGLIVELAGVSNKPITIKLPKARLWHPEDPFLYNLEVSMGADLVRSYFGMRKISIGKDGQGFDRFFLNNREIFLYGVLDQGYWPDGLYTAPSDEALRHDIEIAKDFGFNMIRKHMKVEPARWYYWADHIGMLVWQDQPCMLKDGEDWTVDGNQPDLNIPKTSRDSFHREFQEMLDTLQMHPSIVTWVPFNEGWGQHDTNAIIEWIKAYDPTRLVDGPSGWVDRGEGDIIDSHSYYGLTMPVVKAGRVAMLGEFGGYGYPVTGHTYYDNWNYDHYRASSPEALLSVYADSAAKITSMISKGLSGAIFTQLTDVEQETNGVTTYDRQIEKVPAEIVASINRQVIMGTFKIEKSTAVPTSHEAMQMWKHTFAKPKSSWPETGFDDSGWISGTGGFGNLRSPETTIATFWASSDIWMRREFEINLATMSSPQFMIYHTGSAEVYLNGVKVLDLTGATNEYTPMNFSDKALAALRTGKNVLAVHCRGVVDVDHYVDVGIDNWKVSKESVSLKSKL